jgi:hypothetical protein
MSRIMSKLARQEWGTEVPGGWCYIWFSRLFCCVTLIPFSATSSVPEDTAEYTAYPITATLASASAAYKCLVGIAAKHSKALITLGLASRLSTVGATLGCLSIEEKSPLLYAAKLISSRPTKPKAQYRATLPFLFCSLSSFSSPPLEWVFFPPGLEVLPVGLGCGLTVGDEDGRVSCVAAGAAAGGCDISASSTGGAACGGRGVVAGGVEVVDSELSARLGCNSLTGDEDGRVDCIAAGVEISVDGDPTLYIGTLFRCSDSCLFIVFWVLQFIFKSAVFLYLAFSITRSLTRVVRGPNASLIFLSINSFFVGLCVSFEQACLIINLVTLVAEESSPPRLYAKGALCPLESCDASGIRDSKGKSGNFFLIYPRVLSTIVSISSGLKVAVSPNAFMVISFAILYLYINFYAVILPHTAKVHNNNKYVLPNILFRQLKNTLLTAVKILRHMLGKAPLPCDVGGLFSIRNIIIAENIIPFLQQIITQLKGFRLKDIVSSTIKLLPQSLKLTTTIEEECHVA